MCVCVCGLAFCHEPMLASMTKTAMAGKRVHVLCVSSKLGEDAADNSFAAGQVI